MTNSGAARTGAAGLVILQLVLLATLALEPYGGAWPRNTLVMVGSVAFVIGGFGVSIWGILGLGSALTASPIPKKRAPLVTHGIYGVVRNPIYSGLFIIGAGLALFGASWWHVVTLTALVALLVVKTYWEEQMLAAAHPDFAEYAARVGRFFPGIGRGHYISWTEVQK